LALPIVRSARPNAAEKAALPGFDPACDNTHPRVSRVPSTVLGSLPVRMARCDRRFPPERRRRSRPHSKRRADRSSAGIGNLHSRAYRFACGPSVRTGCYGRRSLLARWWQAHRNIVVLLTAETARVTCFAHSGDRDPFGFLGMHHRSPDGSLVVRAFRPKAESLELIDARTGAGAGFFRQARTYNGCRSVPSG